MQFKKQVIVVEHKTEESSEKNNPLGAAIGLAVLVLMGVMAWVLVHGYLDRSPKMVTLAAVIKGETYVHSVLPPVVVEHRIQQEQAPETPAVFPLYIDGDDLYVDPDTMKPLVDMMAGEVRLYPPTEKSHYGVASSTGDKAYVPSRDIGTTEVVGEQLVSKKVLLRNGEDESVVRWEFRSKSAEFLPLENCVLKWFWYVVNPSPGETVLNMREILVVPMTLLEEFYGFSTSFDSDNLVLTLRPNSE